MFRLTFRFIGLILLAGAFAALVIDGTRSIAGGMLSLTPLGQTMLWLMPQKFETWKPLVQHDVPKLLWDPIIVNLLEMPTWLVVGGLGILVMLVTQKKRRPKIGYSSR